MIKRLWNAVFGRAARTPTLYSVSDGLSRSERGMAYRLGFARLTSEEAAELVALREEDQRRRRDEALDKSASFVERDLREELAAQLASTKP